MIFVHNIKQNMAVFFCAISANKRDFKNTVIHNAIYMAVFCDISVNKRDFKNTGIHNAIYKHWRTAKVWNTENHSAQVGSMWLDPQRRMRFAFVKWILNSPKSRVRCKQVNETVASWVLSLHHQLLKGPLRHRKYQDNGEHGLRLGVL